MAIIFNLSSFASNIPNGKFMPGKGSSAKPKPRDILLANLTGLSLMLIILKNLLFSSLKIAISPSFTINTYLIIKLRHITVQYCTVKRCTIKYISSRIIAMV